MADTIGQTKEQIRKIRAGDVRTASRLIRNLEDGLPEAKSSIKRIFPHTGRAHVLGITGSPGAGKSTLVDALISAFRKKEKTVGVLAVDPTSPFTGGAILGDRIRMQRHAEDPGVFVRSLATRGALGGLAKAVGDAVHVMDVMGKEIIMVETVGTGQQEVEIINHSHTVVVVLVPGMGDEIQAIKAGIMEIADIFVINKADRDGAGQLASELGAMLCMVTEVSRRLAAPDHPDRERLRLRPLRGERQQACGHHRPASPAPRGEQTSSATGCGARRWSRSTRPSVTRSWSRS